MKSQFEFKALAFACVALLSPALVRAELADWENPRLTGQNNQPPHATMVICPDAKTARQIGAVSNAERVKSPSYRSLKGAWKYHFPTTPPARAPDF
jgi:hypothetical protein